jgi:ribose-phosphate pyrophosphokinase
MPILINNKPIESFKFPGGECHVNVLNNLSIDTNLIVIQAYLYNSDDLVSLLLTIDAIRREATGIPIRLIIPYFPYTRQDRICNSGEALSIKVIADLINSLNCDSVTIFDPHSDVTPALINNCYIRESYSIIGLSTLGGFLHENQYLTFVSPDQGAEKKVRKAAQYFNRRMLCATKVRNVKTGEIINTEINIGSEYDANQDFLIIDDICDGGKTFIELSKKIRSEGMIGNIYLYVTHGIFSKGLEILAPHFKKIYCYHTFLPIEKQSKGFLEILGERQRETI